MQMIHHAPGPRKKQRRRKGQPESGEGSQWPVLVTAQCLDLSRKAQGKTKEEMSQVLEPTDGLDNAE